VPTSSDSATLRIDSRLEAVSIGDVDRGGDDPLQRGSASGLGSASGRGPHQGEVAVDVAREEFLTTAEFAVLSESLEKRYGEKRALDGFDLAVPYGTVYGLLVPTVPARRPPSGSSPR